MKRKISSLATLIVVLLLLIVPMFAFTASAADTEVTISFANDTQRTSWSTAEQIWENGDVIFTHKKGSGSNIVDNTNPIRVYANSSFTIQAPGNITKIVFNCNNSTYATAMKNSCGGSATVSGNAVTVTLDGTSDTYSVAKMTAQARINSLTVTYIASESSCSHANKTTTTVEADCLNPGSTKVTCNDCKEVIEDTVIPAKGHNYVDGKCLNCNDVLPIYTCEFITPNKTSTATTQTGSMVMPAGDDVAGEKYTFVGWAKEEVVSSTVAPMLYRYGETVEITEDTKFYAIYSYVEEGNGPSFIKKDLLSITSSDIVVITMSKDGKTYGMTNGNGTGSAPSAVELTVSGDTLSGEIVDSVKWNISVSNGNITIYPNGITDKWLYCTNTNNGVRVGVNTDNTFTLDSSGYLKHTATSRFVGVYNSADWRCYTTNSNNIANQTFAFYVYSDGSITHYTSSPKAAECSHTNLIKTVEKEATCTEEGSYSVTCGDCSANLPDEVIPYAHNNIGGICVKCGYSETPSAPVDGGWTLVTDVSTLKPGDQIIIVAKDSNYALSTTQNTNNRGQAAVNKSNNTVTFGSDVQILTLRAGNVDGTFAFYTGSGYLYAASSSSNNLKTETTLSNNSSWKITIANGTTKVIAQGNNERNEIRYNSTSSLFSCYSTGQQDIVIYKLETGSAGEDAEIYGASMTVGTNLAMNYYVSGAIGSDYYMTFTVNGTVYKSEEGVSKYGYLVFTFKNIPPQMMGESIAAKLYTTEGDTLLDEISLSVKEYAQQIIANHSGNAKLMNLIADMLRYGAAAQEYVGYKADAETLVTYGIDLSGKGSNATPDSVDLIREIQTNDATTAESYYFTAVGVRFDFDNKIYVKVKADKISEVKVTCNGSYMKREDLGDGTYLFCMSTGVSATEFGKQLNVVLYVNDKSVQTITYSINSYIYTKYSDGKSTDIDTLAIALYNYGVSAKAYLGV